MQPHRTCLQSVTIYCNCCSLSLLQALKRSLTGTISSALLNQNNQLDSMMWLQLWVLALPLGLLTFKAQPASTQIPTEIYPSHSPTIEPTTPPIEEEDLTTSAALLVDLTTDHDTSRTEKEDGETTELPGDRMHGENDISETTQECTVKSKDLQRLLQQKDELQERIKVLEQEKHNLNLAIKRNASEEGIIDTFGSNGANSFVTSRPVDCADHLVLGATTSGVYEIYPFTCLCSKPVRVYCDMDTDGGGWTVFMARHQMGDTINFNRSWSEYKSGFGEPLGEFWLGNKHLHTMTSSRDYTLRLDVHLTSGDIKLGIWYGFGVFNEASRYKITLTSYSSESTMYTDCLQYINNQYFSTYDRDNDGVSGNCAARLGGFWHYRCTNRFYPTAFHGAGLTSTCFNQESEAATFVQLKIRPVVCGSTFKTVYLNSYDCDKCH